MLLFITITTIYFHNLFYLIFFYFLIKYFIYCLITKINSKYYFTLETNNKIINQNLAIQYKY